MVRSLLCLSLWFLAHTVVEAYWLRPTRAEIIGTRAEFHIEEDSIRLGLYIGPDDTDKFSRLLLGKKSEVNNFFASNMTLSTDYQDTLHGKLVKRGDWAAMFPESASQQSTNKKRTARYEKYVEVLFSLSKTPTRVDVKPFTHQGEIYRLGMIWFHLSLPVIEVQALAQDERVILDWKDPWKSRFTNKRWARYPKSPALSFLYVESKEVRHEVLLRPVDLKPWLDKAWMKESVWGLNHREQIKKDVGQFLLGRNPLLVDAKPAELEITQIDFMHLSSNGVMPVGELEMLRPKGALIGVMLTHSQVDWPLDVELKWDLFGETIQEVAAKVADDVQEASRTLREGKSKLQWVSSIDRRENNGKDSISSEASIAESVLRFAGFGSMKEEKQKEVMQTLLMRIYGAFDYRKENQIYDSLAKSVQGDLLQQIYLEIKQTLTIQNKGGVRVKVNVVEILDAETVESFSGGYIIKTKWNVSGTVGHWGHTHRRTNQYLAEIKIEAVEGVWKLIDLELLDELRL